MFKKQEKHITDQDAKRSLPHNRKELFFDLLKHRKMTLFTLSCFTFMFFIPLATMLFIFNFYESMAIANDKIEVLFSLVFYSMIIMIPCMIIGFIGLSGAFYVAKKMVWQEGVIVGVDFFQGIKENWKHGLMNGFIFSVCLFGLVAGGSYLLINFEAAPVWSGVGIGALIIFFWVFGTVVALNNTQDVYYTNTYGATLKNSFCLMGLLHYRVFLTFLFSTGIVIALACFNLITLGIGLFLFAILNSVVIILYTLVSHYGFDKYINQEHYPEFVNKGLYKSETNDKEA